VRANQAASRTTATQTVASCSAKRSHHRRALPAADTGPRVRIRSSTSDLVRSNDIVFARSAPPARARRTSRWRSPVRALLDKQIREVIVPDTARRSRPASGSAFCPARSKKRSDPYLRPLFDALHDMIEPDKLQRLVADDTIEVAPLAFLAAVRTLNEAFIVLDEAQNTTPAQMKMFLTRMGYRSAKLVITGDPTADRPAAGPAQRPARRARPRRRLFRGYRHDSSLPTPTVVRHLTGGGADIRAYDARDRARFESRDRGDEIDS